MSSLRFMTGLIAIAAAVVLAQPTAQTRAKEAALKDNLLILRQAIDKYAADQQSAPQTLHDLIANGYLGSIPIDPMTGRNSTWRVVMEDAGRSANRNKPGIYDVHSGSSGVSSEGTRYADW
jgi:general secretion pathway protein G